MEIKFGYKGGGNQVENVGEGLYWKKWNQSALMTPSSFWFDINVMSPRLNANLR